MIVKRNQKYLINSQRMINQCEHVNARYIINDAGDCINCH